MASSPTAKRTGLGQPLPPPPRLKTTIIQLNKDIDPDDHNYEVLSNDYNQCSSTLNIMEEAPKKRRRRTSLFVDKDEMVRRRAETKQLHSRIEKRRRIKINREFEALQCLIPACRALDGPKKSGARGASARADGSKVGCSKIDGSKLDGSKVDGMYKLTILKTSVEYIMYLHHIIQQQHRMLRQTCPDYDFDVSFSEVPLDVNQYRNIDMDYVFGHRDAFPEDKAAEQDAPLADSGRSCSSVSLASSAGVGCSDKGKGSESPVSASPVHEAASMSSPVHNEASAESSEPNQSSRSNQSSESYQSLVPNQSSRSNQSSESYSSLVPNQSSRSNQSLVSNHSLASIQSLLPNHFLGSIQSLGPAEDETWTPTVTPLIAGKRSGDSRSDEAGFSSHFAFQSSRRAEPISLEASPFTIPLKSQAKSGFLLPDPALAVGSDARAPSMRDHGPVEQGLAVPGESLYVHSLPRKKFFKSVPPASSTVVNVYSGNHPRANEDLSSVAEASEALLTFRKPSIERLLN